MINFLIALSGDIFAIVVFVRGYKLINRPQQKMVETKSDYEGRRLLGYIVCAFAVIAIVANHLLFKF